MKSYMREIQYVYRCKSLNIERFVRYFLGIMSILGFYDFVIFPNRLNTLILKSCSLCFQE